MSVTMLKGKIHLATVTHANLNYEGSCGIDRNWMDDANILPYEQIHILNVNNGERFITYAIPDDRDSRRISVNGAAARKAMPGDKVIICAYETMDEDRGRGHKPSIVNLAKSQ